VPFVFLGYKGGMSPLPFAITAGIVGALIEYPLAKRYPLRDPISMPARMAAAGALAFVSVYVTFGIVSALKLTPKLPKNTADR
jgi:hypothetical protein